MTVVSKVKCEYSRFDALPNYDDDDVSEMVEKKGENSSTKSRGEINQLTNKRMRIG